MSETPYLLGHRAIIPKCNMTAELRYRFHNFYEWKQRGSNPSQSPCKGNSPPRNMCPHKTEHLRIIFTYVPSCTRWESNPHASRHSVLSRACLPFHHECSATVLRTVHKGKPLLLGLFKAERGDCHLPTPK